MKALQFKNRFKKWALASAFLGVALYAHSQSTFIIAPRVGSTVSWYSGLPNTSPQINLTGGLSMQYKPWTHFGVSADVLYARRGVSYQIAASGDHPEILFDREIVMKYIEVPIMATYEFNNTNDNIRPRVMLGPSLNFLLDGKHKGEGAAQDVLFSETDLSIVAGAGVNVKIKERIWFLLETRYTHSFTDMNQYNRIVNIEPVRNRNIGLLMGIGFTIGKSANKEMIK